MSTKLNKIQLEAEIARLTRQNANLLREFERVDRENMKLKGLAPTPFELLKAFVPALDMEADGTFDLTSLNPAELNEHLQHGHLFYNSLPINREISAMVAGLQHYALIQPDTSPEGFKLSRQCLAFIKGFIDRFKELANMYEVRLEEGKNKSKTTRTTTG